MSRTFLPRAPLMLAVGACVALSTVASCFAAPRVLTYRWPQGATLRYKIEAKASGRLPSFETTEPIVLEMAYAATAKARSANGTTPVDFRVLSAEVALGPLPYEVPQDQARKLFDQSVALKPTGEVASAKDSAPLPFSLSIPGLDPKQLHTLIVPVVFPATALKPGDEWTFQSAFLGKDAAAPFKAVLVSYETVPQGKSTPAKTIAVIRTEFGMEIDQKLGADKKPAEKPEDIDRTRKGKITGSGLFRFDVGAGRLARGQVTVDANIGEDRLGKLESPDEPRHIDTVVHAVVTVAPDAPRKVETAKTKPAPRQSKQR